MDEIKKMLKECYLPLKREHGWSEDVMALNMKSSSNQSRNIKKGNKGRFSKGRCNHCGKYGHKKADCWDMKNKQEKSQVAAKVLELLHDHSKPVAMGLHVLWDYHRHHLGLYTLRRSYKYMSNNCHQSLHCAAGNENREKEKVSKIVNIIWSDIVLGPDRQMGFHWSQY